MAKHKRTVSKHDMRRGIEELYSMILTLQQRIVNIEYVLDAYIGMKKDHKKFKKFLEKKVDEENAER